MPFSGKKLKQCRDRRNWSLSDLAQTSGVNKGYLSNLENGVQANPGLDIVEKLATVFKVPLDHFSDSKRSTAGSLTELPDGLRQFMDRQPLDRKSLDFLRHIVALGPTNWSAQAWESVYKSYLESRPGGGLGNGRK